MAGCGRGDGKSPEQRNVGAMSDCCSRLAKRSRRAKRLEPRDDRIVAHSCVADQRVQPVFRNGSGVVGSLRARALDLEEAQRGPGGAAAELLEPVLQPSTLMPCDVHHESGCVAWRSCGVKVSCHYVHNIPQSGRAGEATLESETRFGTSCIRDIWSTRLLR
jgi:hypothetical protein